MKSRDSADKPLEAVPRGFSSWEWSCLSLLMEHSKSFAEAPQLSIPYLGFAEQLRLGIGSDTNCFKKTKVSFKVTCVLIDKTINDDFFHSVLNGRENEVSESYHLSSLIF